MVNTSGANRDFLLMREYSATVGATDGNIIAPIMTIQTPRNQPNVPRPSKAHRPCPASVRRSTTSRHSECKEEEDQPHLRADGGERRA